MTKKQRQLAEYRPAAFDNPTTLEPEEFDKLTREQVQERMSIAHDREERRVMANLLYIAGGFAIVGAVGVGMASTQGEGTTPLNFLAAAMSGAGIAAVAGADRMRASQNILSLQGIAYDQNVIEAWEPHKPAWLSREVIVVPSLPDVTIIGQLKPSYPEMPPLTESGPLT